MTDDHETEWMDAGVLRALKSKLGKEEIKKINKARKSMLRGQQVTMSGMAEIIKKVLKKEN